MSDNPKKPEADRRREKAADSREAPTSSGPGASVDRRNFLRAGAAMSFFAGGLFGSQAIAHEAAATLTVPDGMREQGHPILHPAYGLPSPFEKDVVRRARERRATDTAATSFAPLQDSFGIVTPMVFVSNVIMPAFRT
jgi:hypothetical protein